MSKYTINLNVKNPRKLMRITRKALLDSIFATNPEGCKVYFDLKIGLTVIECDNRSKDLPEYELHWLEVEE